MCLYVTPESKGLPLHVPGHRSLCPNRWCSPTSPTTVYREIETVGHKGWTLVKVRTNYLEYRETSFFVMEPVPGRGVGTETKTKLERNTEKEGRN